MKQTLLSFLLALLPIVASADAVKIDGIYYNLISKAGIAEVTSDPNGYNGDIVIPETVEYNNQTYSVQTIKSETFFYSMATLNNITSLHIPSSIKKIEKAFSYYLRIGSVHITDLEAWFNISFEDDDLNGSFYSNPLITTNHLYLNDEEVKDLIVPSNISTIGNGTLQGASFLTSITLHNGITSIGNRAFYGSTGLTTVNIPSSISSIGNGAFGGCTGLNSVHITDMYLDRP